MTVRNSLSESTPEPESPSQAPAPASTEGALLKAIRLAPTLEICEALLRGEKVPRSKLDPVWLKAYGR